MNHYFLIEINFDKSCYSVVVVNYNHFDTSLEVTFNNRQIPKKLKVRNYFEMHVMLDITLLFFVANVRMIFRVVPFPFLAKKILFLYILIPMNSVDEINKVEIDVYKSAAV